ncbi:MAG: SIMPL domain-containing protein [Chloroflexota bacterium]
MKTKRLTWIAAGLVAVVVIAGLAGCTGGTTLGTGAVGINLNSQQEGIWVNGTGKVSAVPDIAIVSLGVEAQAGTVGEAQGQAAGAMDAVIKALKNNGVQDKDIQTQQFSIQKVSRWDNDKQQEIILGYRVTNTVTAKIRDLARSGAVIDAVATAGGDLTRINSIGFTIEDPTQYQQQARQKAVADAAAKAKQLADNAGVTLGKATYITENTYFPGPIFRAGMAEAAAPAPMPDTPISPGEQEVTVNVQITYSILN